ncbi:MAG TPA: hypothetical protein VGS08_04100 [Candidatus Saccharimonadales bacterium]|nr:hypothetical protein [Candidatus Saccharimonadales bacterium]
MKDIREHFPLYTRVLRLYPKPYRQRYGLAILQTTADMFDDAQSLTERIMIWVRMLICRSI